MSNYSSLQDHRVMVFDDLRNNYYAQAIKQAVYPDSVVLDLGAGLGLHGFIAAQSGARKVYLVEPTPIIEVSRQLVNTQNLSTQIECISGRVEEIELPEKVDIIISVFTGNFLLTEDLLPSLFHARDRYLKPSGKLIPDRAAMVVTPVCAPQYYAKHIDCWNSKSQGIPFDPVRGFAANCLFHDTPGHMKAQILAEPADLMEMDFMAATEASCRNRISVEITQNALCHGCLGWVRLHLGDQWLSTSPLEEQTHWRQVFLPLAKPVTVTKGGIMTVELDRPEFGEWTWSMEYGGKQQRQSTFLSQAITPAALQRKSDSHKPLISAQGEAAKAVLSRLNGKQSTAEIVEHMMDEYQSLFPTQKLADRFVKNLVDQYCL